MASQDVYLLKPLTLSFEWPETGEGFNASAPLPGELKSVLTALEVKSAAAAGPRPAT